MVFSAVALVSSFEADDDTIWSAWAREAKKSKTKQTTVGFVTPY